MQTNILSLDHEARGVARVDGKTIFINQALPLETVRFHITQDKGRYAQAESDDIIQPSPYRRTPDCVHFGQCGGCVLQHAEWTAQVAYKQRIFEEQLQRIGKVFPEQMLPPIYGMPWGYRSRTRMAIWVDQHQSVHIGYQAKRSSAIVPVVQCPVLPAHVSGSLQAIREQLQRLHDAVPNIRLEKIDIAVGERTTALNIISQQALPIAALHQFSGSLNAATGQNWQIWQQIGRAAAQMVTPDDTPELYYRLPEFQLKMPFRMGDFTQINLPMNEMMVARVMRLLQAQTHEKIVDLFCGLGNFTLPIARSGAKVIGIEGADGLTQRAMNNAHINGLHNITFKTANLFAITQQDFESLGYFDKMVLDPPRAGAYELVQILRKPYLPKRIVYVSCNPATFARDAAVLVSKGYCFRLAGVMNLFPHTAHVEAIAVFDWR